MTADASSYLAEAAAQRTLDAQARARGALAELDRAGEEITFAAVARRARVSRQFLYSHDELRTEIAQLRTFPAQTSPAIPAHARASENALRTRLRAALDENQHLRTELTRLRGELAVALGRNRELELHRRSS